MNVKGNIQIITKIIILLAILFMSSKLIADEREEPIDLIIALDISKSMEEEIDAVKEYIITNIITDRLIPEDYLLVIGFYKEAEVITAGIIYGDNEKAEMKQLISKVNADESWTDIGNMFDRLRDEFMERSNNNRKKRFLIITDSINEPPPNSPYYNPEGTLKHDYIEKIDDLVINPGWKVQILAIGEDPGTNVFWKDIVKGTVTEIQDPTTEKIEEALEVIGEMKIVKEKLKKLTIKGSGKGTFIIPVTTELYSNDPALIINTITIKNKNFTLNILPKTYTQILPKDSIKQAIAEGKGEDQGIVYLRIPINAGKKLKSGNYMSEIDFTFDTDIEFTSPIMLTVHVNNIWEDSPWLLILLIIIAIALLVILIIGIFKLIQGHPIKFKIIVDEMPLPKGKDTFKLSRGKNLYLLESMELIRVTDKKNLRCFAKMTVVNEDLKLVVLKDNNFVDPAGIPENVLEATIELVTNSGKKYHTTFSEIT